MKEENNYSEEIEKIQCEISILKEKLRILKELEQEEEKKKKMPSYIKHFESRYPHASKQNFEGWVLKNETFEEWLERYGKLTRGYDTGFFTLEALEKFYEIGGFHIGQEHKYVQALIGVKDERILNTKIYELVQNGATFLVDGLKVDGVKIFPRNYCDYSKR